ncbi:MAG TPA: ATP-dependent zinc metalloprotease FtsH [Acidobacteriota bacterium]|nr:ATP-dependent zinc metalloprotease FtsH [Acidobacteriota bacterium]
MAEENKNQGAAAKRRVLNIIVVVVTLVIILSLWSGGLFNTGTGASEISYSDFKRELNRSNVKTAHFEGEQITGTFVTPVGIDGRTVSSFRSMLPPYEDANLAEVLESHNVTISSSPVSEDSWVGALLMNLLFIGALVALWFFMMRRFSGQAQSQLSTFTKGHHKLYKKEQSRVTFADVAGMPSAKEDLAEVVAFLKDPEKFKRLGGKIPKGVLLIGPPGTGKTLLARATAGEADVAFFSLSGSEFIEMLVGVGAARVRSLFKDAKTSEPSIIFIDEIDSIGRVRGTGLGGGHDEREQTLNQLLSEMDGFVSHDEVIVLAATNRPDVLDPALLRPGRFDRKVLIDSPQLDERLAILKIHSRNKPLSEDVDLENLARTTAGLSGADLENILNESALLAARKSREDIKAEDLREATDKILIGSERRNLLHETEKGLVAFHESGHTLVAWVLPTSDPLHKVSIIPRGMSLGHTLQLPERDKHIHRRAELLDRLRVLLAGRAAERVFLDDVSSGGQNDFKVASELARRMVCLMGMSDEIGTQYIDTAEEHPFLGRAMAVGRNVSEKTAEKIDAEIRRFLDEANADAKAILEQHEGAVRELVEQLLKLETLDADEIAVIMERHGVDRGRKGPEPIEKEPVSK